MEEIEESDLSNPSRDGDETLDPVINKKHLSMLDRLSKSQQSRSQKSLSRKSESSDSSSIDSTSAFLSRFSDSKRSIESQFAEARRTDPSQIKSYLDKISVCISDLEKLVAEKSYFLPSYEVRSSLKTISDLKQSLENLNFELVPKKKFSFRNKAATKEPIKASSEIQKFDEVPAEKLNYTVRDSPGFRNREGEVLVKDFKGLEVGEFAISDLDSCEIRLTGCVRALFIHRLKNCRVYAGPVSGSILIEEVEGCVFVVASHQIRIHNAKKTDFYLRVRSRPIIEYCSNVRFAPYCLSYEGIEDDLRDTNLAEETGNWANVDDFRWLRAVQSPNWSILPENERMSETNISNFETREKHS